MGHLLGNLQPSGQAQAPQVIIRDGGASTPSLIFPLHQLFQHLTHEAQINSYFEQHMFHYWSSLLTRFFDSTWRKKVKHEILYKQPSSLPNARPNDFK